MSQSLEPEWPLAAFGDLEGNVWGVLIGGPDPRLAIGDSQQDTVDFQPADVDGLGGDEEWRATSDGGSVRIGAPLADAIGVHPAGAEAPAICRASGTIALGGRERELDAGAVRFARLPAGRLDSIRLTGAWFAPGHAVVLLATRPHGAAGQDRDAIAVGLIGEEANVAAFDPRLSTTYNADGTVSRMGIELWLGETEDGEHYPRRVAGERAGAGADAILAGARIEALPMRCHGRGDEGAGVYVLLRPA